MTAVAIIGGGHIGKTLLADLLSRPGSTVRSARLLFFRSPGAAIKAEIAEWCGPIEFNEQLVGLHKPVVFRERHFGSLWDEGGRETLELADVIIVTLPDIPRVRLELLDCLCGKVDLSDKTLVLMRAGQAGQPVIAHRARFDSALRDSHVFLVEDAFYGSRAAHRRIDAKCKHSVNVAIYSRAPQRPLQQLRGLFPPMPGTHVPSWPDFKVKRGIELLFDPLGYIVHVGIALWPANLARTRQNIAYNHYVGGVDRELAAVLDALDHERVALAAAYGVAAESFPQILHRQYRLPVLSDFYAMMQSCKVIYRSMSAGSVAELRRSRYVHEDIPALETISWLAGNVGLTLTETAALRRSVPGRLASVGIDPDIAGSYRAQLHMIDPDPDSICDLLTQPHQPDPAPETLSDAELPLHAFRGDP
ncbi:MAG: NAD/NADP octopine/nopaline dehydrogenase family protein [Hyphomicrobiales bacterium]|nr:NAD/NADP octopine/nopaline dehydrogenase family protein [Hyphomicrobiales bacterium]MBV8824267.1 NAD/NADP octopine/nopaline dehydrogenase family protein [Hyphomicrobiales bacterium]MBV9428577.1 NAD/NADP octopine/nopaline dehydrogenase family protein [Bradyrhizobiaceae bacterium]